MERFLSALMLVIMLSTCIILPVSAEKPSISSTEALYGSTEAAPNTDAAYVIGTDCKTLKEAFASAPTDGTSVTYTLSDNVTYDSRLTVPAGTKITLDLAGYALTYNGTTSRSCIYVAGNLTVKGTGSVTNLSTSYNGHVFTVWTGGALTVSGDATFSADGGDAIHCVGGTVVSVSAGTFTSAKADAVSLTGLSKLLSVTGGTFIGKNALYAGAGSTVTTVSGGSFSGRQNGMYIKAAGTVKTLGEASVSSAVGGKYAVTNLGTIKKIDGAKLISTGAGTLCNYGTVGAVSAQTTFNYTSPVRGVGAAIVNYGTLGGTVEGTVTSNANGILNHGGKLTTVKTTIQTVRGIGIYNRAGGMIININANITVCNRAAVFNTGEGTKITSFTGGTYISTCEKEGTTDDRAIGIYTADGATIGRIAVTKVESYGACIANDGAAITAIQRGIFTSSTISIANKNGGVIGEIRSGTFTPDYDWDTVFPGTKKSVSIVKTALYPLNGGTILDYPASTWTSGATQFFVTELTESQFNEITVPGSPYARFVNNNVTDETATEDIYHYYSTYLDDATFGETSPTVKFFTSKIVERASGNTTYLLGVYSNEKQTLPVIRCTAENENRTFSIAITVNSVIAGTEEGRYPEFYGDNINLITCEESGIFHDITLSGDARLALLGGVDLTKPATEQKDGASQFYVLPITAEQFNALLPAVTSARYVNHLLSDEMATEDIYRYYHTRLDGGQVTGDDGFRYFVQKIVSRVDGATSYQLGIYTESARDVSSIHCTVESKALRAVIAIDGMAPLAATPAGERPLKYYSGQSLVACEGSVPSGTAGVYGTRTFYANEQTAEGFRTYCQGWEASGCELVSVNKIGDNEYVTFRREGEIIYMYYTGATGEIRTVIDNVSKVSLSTEPQTYDKIAETAIIQLVPDFWSDGSWGMGYLLQLEDGRFIVIDGGEKGNGTNADRILSLMKSMNRREDGKIVIASWILTHDHPDHFQVFSDFASRLADQVVLEQVMVNTHPLRTVEADYYLAGDKFLADVKKFGDDVPLYIPQEGQVFYLANARFEILNTAFSAASYSSNINNTSLVFRMTIDDCSFLWTADIEKETSESMLRRFGSYLKSDILQMPHHGYNINPVVKEFYATVDATVLFQDTIKPNADAWCQPGVDGGEVNDYAINKLHAQERFIADSQVTGDCFTKITLPYVVGTSVAIKMK